MRDNTHAVAKCLQDPGPETELDRRRNDHRTGRRVFLVEVVDKSALHHAATSQRGLQTRIRIAPSDEVNLEMAVGQMSPRVRQDFRRKKVKSAQRGDASESADEDEARWTRPEVLVVTSFGQIEAGDRVGDVQARLVELTLQPSGVMRRVIHDEIRLCK